MFTGTPSDKARRRDARAKRRGSQDEATRIGWRMAGLGIETMSFADSNGLSFDPATEYATSVGRGHEYVPRAEVLQCDG